MTFRLLCKNVCQKLLTGPCKSNIYYETLRFARVKGGPKRQSLSSAEFQDYIGVEDDDHDVDLSDIAGNPERRQLEDFMSNVNIQDPETRRELKRLEKDDRQRLKRIIIKKKLHKKKPELNVLTWQAKEQMRYLHQENPDEWDVDRLVESFPTSKEGVLSILRSSYVPRNEAEIRKHDSKAAKNIELIKDSLENGDLEIDEQEKEQLQNKLAKLGNAAGIKSLPLTKIVTRQTIAAQSKLLRPSKKIGPFQSMLMYYDKMTSDAQIQQDKYVLLPEARCAPNAEEDKMAAENVKTSSNSSPNSTRDVGFNVADTNNKISHQSGDWDLQTEQKHEKKVDKNNRTVLDMNRHLKRRNISTQDISLKHRTDEDETALKRKNNFHKQNNQDSFELSGKNWRPSSKSVEENHMIMNKNLHVPSKNNNRCLSSQEDFIKIKSKQKENLEARDTDTIIKKWNSEPEVYASDRFGKVVTKKMPYGAVMEEFNIPKPRRRRSLNEEESENIVYDEHGEFLYKIP